MRIKKGLFFVGMLAALGWAPFHWVMSLALSLNILMIRLWFCHHWREALCCGWWWGWGFYMTSLFWIGNSLWVDALRFAWFWPLSLLGIPGMLACYPALAMALLVGLKKKSSALMYGLLFVGVWSFFEFVQGHLFTGFPWNLLAYMWAPILPMAQGAAFLGSYGLGLCTLLLLTGPGIAFLVRQGLWIMGLACTLMGLMIFYTMGAYRLRHTASSFYPDIYIRLVQAAIPQKEKGKPQYAMKHFQILRYLSCLPSARPLSHVIWYEGAIPWGFSSSLLSLFPGVGNQGALLAGCAYRENEYKVLNALMVHYPGKSLSLLYAKNHLLPFGEYIPFRGFLECFMKPHWLKKITPGAMDFSPGSKNNVTKCIGLPPFRALICYEAIFPGTMRGPGQQPLWLLNITNDGWFGRSPGPYQHFVSAQFRAIEEGLPLIRVANSGISAVVDPLGRVIRFLPLKARAVIDSLLPRALSSTLYSQFQDKIWYTLMLVLMCVYFLLKWYDAAKRRHSCKPSGRGYGL